MFNFTFLPRLSLLLLFIYFYWVPQVLLHKLLYASGNLFGGNLNQVLQTVRYYHKSFFIFLFFILEA